ncbi:AAA family ATPase [Chloroflexales bacterium ZM16-3]|nr:AAA family ATPase [Chloroflexales bacterium ZM16-3]
MLRIRGYHLIEQIAENAHSIVYRARSEQDQLQVILKLPIEPAPSPSQQARFLHEYDLLRSLDLPGVIGCYRLEHVDQRSVLVLEDFGGTALSRLNLAGQLDVDDFLRIASDITTIIGRVHQAQVVHKDITPGNLVYNPATGEIKLIDFSLATRLRREEVAFQSPTVLEGTLPYIAPEQTGRMNRAVDYRSDFYSLGCTLYELLTGQLPFPGDDPLELVHAHMARMPIPPHQVAPNLPPALSAIIMKLLAKTAEDRYQSADGLMADLAYCRQHLASPDMLASFTPGGSDRAEQFQIPQALYGRADDVAQLVATFDRVAAGGRELLLVTGPSGVGKTVLVHEIHKPVTARQGYFIEGKFDQYQRLPYLAWVHALTGLVYQLLTENDLRLANWRATILAALGDNGRLLTDMIPNLELIIGPQPPVPLLEGREAQYRLEFTFRNFIRALARPEHPLAVFLDDLQWADPASLNLLDLLFGEHEADHLLVIGAYRDNEVAPAHQLMITLSDLRQAGAPTSALALSLFSQADMSQLIGDTLGCPADLAGPLTDLVYQRTGGNPFYTAQFLYALHDEGLITFHAASRQWQCDMVRVRGFMLTDDMLAFMAQQLQKLPPETQQLLSVAACIGSQFDQATLALALEQAPEATDASFWPVLQEGLVIRTNEPHQLVQSLGQAAALRGPDEQALRPLLESQRPSYRFLHDQVQQAAYSLLSEAQRQVWHLRIGQRLLRHTPEADLPGRLFEIVHQLNRGSALLVEPDERLELAQLNLQAGQRARAATAYGAAHEYFAAGCQLLPADSWQQHYALTLSLYESAAEAAYLSGDGAEMGRMAATVMRESHTILDQIKIYEVSIQSLVAQNKFAEAVQTGLQALELLGIAISADPEQGEVFVAFQETQAACQELGVAALIDLPPMTDPRNLAAMRILTSVLPVAFLTSPSLYALCTFKEVYLSIKHGNTSISAHSYACYALMLCGVFGDIETGYQFGQLALDLLRQLNAKEFESKVQSMVHAFVAHWKNPIRDMLPPLRAAYDSGLETGDLQFAGYSAVLYSAYTYFAGIEKNLADLQAEALVLSKSLAQLKQITAVQYYQMLHQAAHDLIVGRASAEHLHGEYYDEEAMLPLHLQANDRMGLFYLYLHKLLRNYLLGDYQQAVVDAAQVEQYLDGGTGTSYIPLFYAYDSLARLAAHREVAQESPDDMQARVAASQEKLAAWALSAPSNWSHLRDLVEAERQRTFGTKAEAIEAYERAIAGAAAQGFMRDEALANELAAGFYGDWGKEQLAQTYLQAAVAGYSRWGAAAKVAQLEQRHARLLAPRQQAQHRTSSQHPSTHSGTISTTGEISLDLDTVIKASQAIAGEIDLARLLTKMMQIVIENAGAQRGALILERDGEWLIEAQGDVDSPDVTVLQALNLQASATVATGIVYYVARTRDSVVLHDVATSGAFTSDPYVQRQQTKSALCIPLINQDQVSGILYLENNLIAGAFTPGRVELLKVLSAQMAMALNNAHVYARLEAKVVERTRELAKAKEVAEQANDLKTKFLANMSHELRTPLNAILNFTRFLSKERYGSLTDRQVDLQHRVLANADHLLGLINDILDLSKIESGRIELFYEETDLQALLQGVMATAVGLTKDKGLALDLDVADSLPAMHIDKTRIRQVLLNLLSNAAKFTEQGSITMRAAVANDMVQIAVHDTGIGIAPEHMEQIFEEFQQVQSDLQREYQGTGLGLPISRRLIAMHGGRLWAESTPRVGSVFTFTIPLVAQATAPHPEAV